MFLNFGVYEVKNDQEVVEEQSVEFLLVDEFEDVDGGQLLNTLVQPSPPRV